MEIILETELLVGHYLHHFSDLDLFYYVFFELFIEIAVSSRKKIPLDIYKSSQFLGYVLWSPFVTETDTLPIHCMTDTINAYQIPLKYNDSLWCTELFFPSNLTKFAIEALN